MSGFDDFASGFLGYTARQMDSDRAVQRDDAQALRRAKWEDQFQRNREMAAEQRASKLAQDQGLMKLKQVEAEQAAIAKREEDKDKRAADRSAASDKARVEAARIKVSAKGLAGKAPVYDQIIDENGNPGYQQRGQPLPKGAEFYDKQSGKRGEQRRRQKALEDAVAPMADFVTRAVSGGKASVQPKGPEAGDVPEGQTATAPDGKRYVVKGGEWVPL